MTSPAAGSARPVASLSLDLDNQWSYLKTRGEPRWAAAPSYLPTVVPRALAELRARNQRITFFVVGRDAADDENAEVLGALAPAGHEIGNHSFRHEPWLHRYSEAELDDELARAEDAIAAATGVRTEGFRGPGYSLSPATLRVLVRRGYRYDASTLPTYLGPIARALYFRSARLTEDQRAERSQLFGTWADGRRPVAPYRWEVDGQPLLELPVTTLPVLKVPIHVSYLLSLSAYSPAAARAYFAGALELCARLGIGPSLLLHPLDFLSGRDAPDLAFFPGMQLPLADKLERVRTYLDRLQARFDVRPLGEHARALEAGAPLALRSSRTGRRRVAA